MYSGHFSILTDHVVVRRITVDVQQTNPTKAYGVIEYICTFPKHYTRTSKSFLEALGVADRTLKTSEKYNTTDCILVCVCVCARARANMCACV